MNAQITELIRLSQELGREERQLAILGEGNTSARLSREHFAVKASGRSLAGLTEADLTVCRFERLAELLEQPDPTDAEIDDGLLAARRDPDARKPSVEALFHSWLLGLDGIEFVGHCHPVTVNQILCSPRGPELAERRMFPDEVVYCGPVSVFVPYVDPGRVLAREIRERVRRFMERFGTTPRVILLQNHGVIAIGATAQSVLAALLMVNKAAAIFVGAWQMGGPDFLSPQQVGRIAGRSDEAYRQRQLDA